MCVMCCVNRTLRPGRHLTSKAMFSPAFAGELMTPGTAHQAAFILGCLSVLEMNTNEFPTDKCGVVDVLGHSGRGAFSQVTQCPHDGGGVLRHDVNKIQMGHAMNSNWAAEK